MTMDMTEAVGAAAALLTTLAFVPQVVKTLKTRHTRDISLTMWVLFSAGVALWLVYGVLLTAWPIIAANAATLVLALTVLTVKVRNRGQE